MKKILALLLVFATIFAFAACKKTDKDDNGTTTGGSKDAVVTNSAEDVSDSSEAESETEISSDGTVVVKKKTTSTANSTTGKKSNIGTNTVVKPDHNTDNRPVKHQYVITVKKGSNGIAETVTVDGTTYNLKNSNDVAALKKRINDESENDLLGQLYDADSTIAAQLGLSALDEGALLSYKYDPEGEFFYVDDINSWQQQFGFNPLYDYAAGFTVMYYDTVRIYFDYENRGYMLQLWKGQYGLMFVGSEIGFYEKDDKKPTSGSSALNHYECATDHLLPMEMVCYRADSSGNLNPLFKRKYERHWWSTGFVPGVLKKFTDRSEIVVEARITFDTEEMAQIVGDTFKANKFTQTTADKFSIYSPDTYYVNGCDLFFTWRYIQHKKDVVILRPTTTTTTATTTTTTTTTSETAAS